MKLLPHSFILFVVCCVVRLDRVVAVAGKLTKRLNEKKDQKALVATDTKSPLEELHAMSECFSRDCRENEMTLTADEGNAIAERIYPRGMINFNGVLDFKTTKMLLTHVREVKNGGEMIGNVLKLGKFAFLATAILKGSVNPLAAIYFVAKEIASFALGGTAGWIAQNAVGAFYGKQMQICMQTTSMCSVSNGLLDCFDFPSESKYVVPIGEESHAEDGPDNWGTCSAGTCVGANGHCEGEGHRALCWDRMPIVGGNTCICGAVVNKGSGLCFLGGLISKSPTLGTILG